MPFELFLLIGVAVLAMVLKDGTPKNPENENQ